MSAIIDRAITCLQDPDVLRESAVGLEDAALELTRLVETGLVPRDVVPAAQRRHRD